MNDILDRIEQRLIDVGLSASAASVAAGLSKDAIRNIRRARAQGVVAGVNVRTVEALAPVLKTTKSWLLGEGGDEDRVAVPRGQVPFLDLGTLPSKRRDILAGLPFAPDILGDVNFPNPQGSIIATRLADDSMNRLIPKGSIVLTDLSQVELQKHKIYLVSVGDGPVVIRVYEERPERLVPSSVLSGFEAFFDLTSVEVVGRAVAIYNEL